MNSKETKQSFFGAVRVLKCYLQKKGTDMRWEHYDIDQAIRTVMPYLEEEFERRSEKHAEQYREWLSKQETDGKIS